MPRAEPGRVVRGPEGLSALFYGGTKHFLVPRGEALFFASVQARPRPFFLGTRKKGSWLRPVRSLSPFLAITDRLPPRGVPGGEYPRRVLHSGGS